MGFFSRGTCLTVSVPWGLSFMQFFSWALSWVVSLMESPSSCFFSFSLTYFPSSPDNEGIGWRSESKQQQNWTQAHPCNSLTNHPYSPAVTTKHTLHTIPVQNMWATACSEQNRPINWCLFTMPQTPGNGWFSFLHLVLFSALPHWRVPSVTMQI